MKMISLDNLKHDIANGRPQRTGQLARALDILKIHPEAVLIECADERTGVRFGQAKCRAGRCVKIGSARQPYWYQMWISWAACDVGRAKLWEALRDAKQKRSFA